jgi:hypothetical protein
LTFGSCAGNRDPGGGDAPGFKPYPLEGGYPPGTLISLGKKNLVTGQLVPVARFLANLKDQHLLDIEPPRALPATTFDRMREFKLSLGAGLGAKRLDDSAKSTIQKVKTVNLAVNSGQRHLLKSGAVALEDVLEVLPCADLRKIESAFDSSEKVVFVTEAEEYSSGTATFTFKSDVSVAAQLSLVGIISIGGTPQWTDNSTLTVTYSTPILVGYKGREVSAAKIRDASDSTCSKPAPVDSRSVANLIFSFITDNDKHDDTEVSASVYRLSDGFVVASTEYTRKDVWTTNSVREFNVSLTPAISVKEIGQYGVRVCINPARQETWRFTYTVSGNYPAVADFPSGLYMLKDPQLQTLTEASRCIQHAL